MSFVITDKQAVKIAEWMGHYVNYGFGFKVPSNPSTETVDWYMEWLSSPEGQVTLMAQLIQKYDVGIGKAQDGYFCHIGWDVMANSYEPKFIAIASTLHEAVRQAILEMLKC